MNIVIFYTNQDGNLLEKKFSDMKVAYGFLVYFLKSNSNNFQFSKSTLDEEPFDLIKSFEKESKTKIEKKDELYSESHERKQSNYVVQHTKKGTPINYWNIGGIRVYS